jgi:hypothetical protein
MGTVDDGQGSPKVCPVAGAIECTPAGGKGQLARVQGSPRKSSKCSSALPPTDHPAHHGELLVAQCVGPAPAVAVSLGGVGHGAQLQTLLVVRLQHAAIETPVLVATAQRRQHSGVNPVVELLRVVGLGANPVALVEVGQQDVLQQAVGRVPALIREHSSHRATANQPAYCWPPLSHLVHVELLHLCLLSGRHVGRQVAAVVLALHLGGGLVHQCEVEQEGVASGLGGVGRDGLLKGRVQGCSAQQ